MKYEVRNYLLGHVQVFDDEKQAKTVLKELVKKYKKQKIKVKTSTTEWSDVKTFVVYDSDSTLVRRGPDWGFIMLVVAFSIFIAFLLINIFWTIFAFVKYGSMPITEIPSWALFYMWRR